MQNYSRAWLSPFNITGYPSTIKAQARQLPGWLEDRSAAAEPPVSPVDCGSLKGGCGAEVTVLLVPHGATDLRMAGFPYVGGKK